MKLGTRSTFAGRQYEVTSIRPNGCIALRPVRDGMQSNGSVYALGEVCRVLVHNQEFRAVVNSINPLRATVTDGVLKGYEASSRRIRKSR